MPFPYFSRGRRKARAARPFVPLAWLCGLLLVAGCAHVPEERATSTVETLERGPTSEGSSGSASPLQRPSSGSQARSPFDEEIHGLVADLVAQLPKEKPVRVAVFGLTDLRGRDLACGRLIAESMETELVRLAQGEASLSVIDRRDFSLIMSEQRHGASDLVDDAKSVEIGRQAGATALLNGSVIPCTEGSLRVIARVLDTETTEIVAATSRDLPLSRTLRATCLPGGEGRVSSPDLLEAVNPAVPGEVSVWTDKAVYRIGEPVTVHVRSERGGYLYLFDIDAEGRKTLLLPNVYRKRPVRLRPGETFTSPEGWYEAGPPPGRGYLKAVVTPRPLPFEDPEFTDLSQQVPFRSLSKGVTRGIVVSAVEGKGRFGTAWVVVTE